MGIREVAERDMRRILGDTQDGGAVTVTLISPDGESVELSGLSQDIYEAIDPETGVSVSGRLATVSLPNRPLIEAFGELPTGVHESAQKPWLARFDDLEGNTHTFKVQESNPDRSIGSINLKLEFYGD